MYKNFQNLLKLPKITSKFLHDLKVLSTTNIKVQNAIMNNESFTLRTQGTHLR